MTWNQTQLTMEISKNDYVVSQRNIITGLENMTQAMRDMMKSIDKDLSENLYRDCYLALTVINLMSNTLSDCREELANIDTEEV